ncbi:MAG: RNA polymerase sigma factor [Kiloniellaceae bacterium]
MLQNVKQNLYGYALALTRDREQAADLLQDSVVRAMSSRRVPSDERAFRSWLFTILRNRWIDQVRAGQRRSEVHADLEHADSEAPVTVSEDSVVNRILVRQAFFKLNKDHRDVLAVVDIGGFSYEEASAILDVPRGTVMSRVSRARAALSLLLGDLQVVPFPSSRRGAQNGGS